MSTPPAPFDPNAALRDFNQYFGTLRKQYGSDGLRNMGFTPRDLAALQASLRKLQLDPNSTPEQHQQAYQQARDTLAQRITTPQPTMQTGAPVAAPVAAQPTAAQLAQHAQTLKSDPNIVSSRWDPTAGGGAGAYEYTSAPRPQPPTPMPTPVPPPMPTPDIVQAPTRDVSNYIANMNSPAVSPGGSANFNEATGVYTKPVNPLSALQSALQNPMAPTGATPPSTSGGIMGLIGSATPPAQAPVFDRNAALRQLNQSFSNLRNTYGVDALRGAGFAPSNLSALQADLRKLQLDNSSTQEQHTAALQNALNTMNSFTNNLKPITSPQTVAPMPMPAPTGASLPQEIVVTGTPRPQPAPPPEPMPVPPLPPVTGMYRGGFAVKR